MAINTNSKALGKAKDLLRDPALVLGRFFNSASSNAKILEQRRSVHKMRDDMDRYALNSWEAANSPLQGPSPDPAFSNPPSGPFPETPFSRQNVMNSQNPATLGVNGMPMGFGNHVPEGHFATPSMDGKSMAYSKTFEKYMQDNPYETSSPVKINDQGVAESTVPRPLSDSQPSLINATRKRLMKGAATKREADLKANYATSDLTVDSKRASRAEAVSQRRAETQERQLSRDTNMAYREAIRRGDRAGALRVRQGAIRDNVQFGGIRQHGDISRNVAAARQNAFDDERGRLDALAAARKGVPGFQGGSRPSGGVQPLSSVIDNVGQPAGAAYYNPNQYQTYGPDRKAVASSHDVVKRKVPNSLALKQSKTPL